MCMTIKPVSQNVMIVTASYHIKCCILSDLKREGGSDQSYSSWIEDSCSSHTVPLFSSCGWSSMVLHLEPCRAWGIPATIAADWLKSMDCICNFAVTINTNELANLWIQPNCSSIHYYGEKKKVLPLHNFNVMSVENYALKWAEQPAMTDFYPFLQYKHWSFCIILIVTSHNLTSFKACDFQNFWSSLIVGCEYLLILVLTVLY